MSFWLSGLAFCEGNDDGGGGGGGGGDFDDEAGAWDLYKPSLGKLWFIVGGKRGGLQIHKRSRWIRREVATKLL